MAKYRTLIERQYDIRPYHITARAPASPPNPYQHQKKKDAATANNPAPMSNLSPHAKPFDPATWCMEPRTPTPDFSPLSHQNPLQDPAHQPLSYAAATKPRLPEPFPAYESPLQIQPILREHPQKNVQMSQRRNEGVVGGAQTEEWTSPIWNTSSGFNLHTYDPQARRVGEYGVALDAPLPAFGQGKWVNGGPDRQEMPPIGFEMRRWTSNMGNLTMRVRMKMRGEQQRHLFRIGSSTNNSGGASASRSSVPSLSPTSPNALLATSPSSSITTPRTPFTATHPVTPLSLNFTPTTSTETSPEGMQSANIDDAAQKKGITLEKQVAELTSSLSDGMPVINMAELNSKFGVPQTLDESAYESLSDFAHHSVLAGNLTLIEGHIIQRQLFLARCIHASSFAVHGAAKASAEKAFGDTAGNPANEAGTFKASVNAAGNPSASSSVSSGVCAKAYIPFVSSRIGTDALKATLTAFGQVTYFDINRHRRCAFVEFATIAQFRAAFDANPHMVGEDRDIIRVEARRVKNGR